MGLFGIIGIIIASIGEWANSDIVKYLGAFVCLLSVIFAFD